MTTVAIAAASGVGAALVTQAARVAIEWVRQRRARQDQWVEDTGKVIVGRMEVDLRDKEQLRQWMRDEREGRERAERRIENLQREYWDLKRAHDQCNFRLDRIEKVMNELRRTLPAQYAVAIPGPSSFPPREEGSE